MKRGKTVIYVPPPKNPFQEAMVDPNAEPPKQKYTRKTY
eukprot:CAMPEP_0194325124 /NCGR_PEP_ID=MMETSP0171-20130528/29056_1 /TAXON_ID=218684 /ORGANISM="Corethron pennatum, Strain L29A3" /LENGTH=38 /DNA_ID= /DNA_START= /DNA_END= /DNA_ORIENTATION=